MLWRNPWGFKSPRSHHPSRLRRFGWQATQAEKVCEGVSHEAHQILGMVVDFKNGEVGHYRMFYVYLIKSIPYPKQHYVGMTDDLKQRLKDHNAGRSLHTSKYKPWELVNYIAFSSKNAAADFEQYLKSGSGQAFSNRHFWK